MDIDSLFAPRPMASTAAPTEANTVSDKKVAEREERVAREREQLQRRLAAHELDDVRTKVAYVLNQHPTCRNSDIELAIRFWKIFHPDDVGSEYVTYESLRSITKITSIARARATIQNDFGLFLADDSVTDFRNELEGKVRRRQRAVAKVTNPFVYVYADESGKTDRNYIVGGVWVNDVDEQSYKLRKTLNEWRKSVKWTSEIHFTEASKDKANDYLDFVTQAMTASEYIGFKAVILSREDVKKRPTEDAIFNLYYRLIVSGMQHEVRKHRCSLPRNVVVHKDEDETADKLHLLTLRDRLSSECLKQFDNQVDILSVNSLKSSSHILMQLADVFTGCINRVVNKQKDKPYGFKDELARAILQVLGVDAQNIEQDVEGDFASIMRL